MRPSPTVNKFFRLVRIAFAMLVLAVGGVSADESALAGRSLADALRILQDRGLRAFFTSNVVSDGMRVEEEPTTEDLREMLPQILGPHGLTTESGPGGRLVVVVAGPAGIRGQVRDRRSARPLAGVRVQVQGSDLEAVTDGKGSFNFVDLGAGSYELEAHRPGFVIQRLEGVQVPHNTMVPVVFELEATILALDEIIVTPSRVSLLSTEPVTALDLNREEILALPHFGDDIFRALTLLPGVSGEEVSARFNVRGGRDDEVLVLLDRLELYEPYHLKDYSSSVSIIPPQTLREVNLMTGGFSAQFGDRMGGVLDMTTAIPEKRKCLLGVGLLNLEVGNSGNFSEDRGHWLGALRRGTLDLAIDAFLGSREKPKYWDGFGKVEYRVRPNHLLSLHALHADDELDFVSSELVDPEDRETYLTSYSSSYLWLGHQGILGSRLFVDTIASVGQVERDRFGKEEDLEEIELGFTLSDDRRFDVFGLKQDWNFQWTENSYLTWGVDVRRLEARYAYLNTRVLEDFLGDFRSEPRTGTTEFRGTLEGEQYGLYLSNRYRPVDPLTLEIGLRYDRQTLTDDNDLSPRFNLAYALGKASTIRAAWGLFYQSQRPYELQVEDGEHELNSAERTEQRVIGFEHTFSLGAKRTPLSFRLEAYQRLVKDPLVRFENLYEPRTEFPEIEPDRFRTAPERSRAQGIELLVRSRVGQRFDWWASYAYARTQDRLEGSWVPRRIDQPHTLNLGFNYRLTEHWNVNMAWRYHTGWPTTAIFGRFAEPEGDVENGEDGEDGEDGEGGMGEEGFEEPDEVDIVPFFGPLNGERLPSYHRLDLRLSGEWQKKRGLLGFFLEIQNAYDRQNVAGFDTEPEFDVLDSGEIKLMEVEEIWGGILPSFGITWEF